jgi:hypothetical protein
MVSPRRDLDQRLQARRPHPDRRRTVRDPRRARAVAVGARRELALQDQGAEPQDRPGLRQDLPRRRQARRAERRAPARPVPLQGRRRVSLHGHAVVRAVHAQRRRSRGRRRLSQGRPRRHPLGALQRGRHLGRAAEHGRPAGRRHRARREGCDGASADQAATLETGLVIQVPSYLESGELVQVDTREARFIARAKKE